MFVSFSLDTSKTRKIVQKKLVDLKKNWLFIQKFWSPTIAISKYKFQWLQVQYQLTIVVSLCDK